MISAKKPVESGKLLNYVNTVGSQKSNHSRKGLTEHSSESRSANTGRSREPSVTLEQLPPAQEKEPTPVSKSTPGSLSKLATSGPVKPATVMRPSVMGLPHE